MKVFITSFLDVVYMFYFGCYTDVTKIRFKDIIIGHPEDIIQGARMKVFITSFQDVFDVIQTSLNYVFKT